jgi:adenylate cyclase
LERGGSGFFQSHIKMIGKPNKSLLGQFYQRKVMRVALAYVVIGWIMMQVGEVTFEALGLPPWALTFLISLLVLGFPVALVLAWAFEVTPEGIVKDSYGVASSAGSERNDAFSTSPSVAVLPFDDMSEHGDQGYFCEGIAEEILNSLCKVAGLRVASRAASFRFRGKHMDIAKIAEKLKVQAILEGSVRQFDDNLRITAQLINATDGYHLWTRQYDRRSEDLFAVQEDIAEQISNALSLTMRHNHLREQSEVVPLAYDYFLRGRYYFARCNSRDSVYARRMFRRAIETDPGYGRAWAWLAYAYGFEYMYFNATDENRREALHNSARALALAPNLAESHIAIGIAYCMRGKCTKAGKSFEKAIKLDPKRYEAWYFYGRTRIREGKPRQAMKLLQKATQCRPEDYQSVLLQAQLYVSLGDTKHAMEASREGVERVRATLEFAPDDNRALNLGAPALLRLGEKEEATQWMQASVANAPGDPVVLYNAACFHSLSGDADKALDLLDRCFSKVGAINPDWLKNDSDLDNIREDPRYAAIVEQTG